MSSTDEPVPFYLCPKCRSVLVLDAGRFVCKNKECDRDRYVSNSRMKLG